MILGPYKILLCPHCQGYLKLATLISGNTFSARQWTDGKMEAPMLPLFPEITRCRHCEVIFWHKDAKTCGKLEGHREDPHAPTVWKEAPRIKKLDVQGLQEALDAGLGSSVGREKNLRIELWWAINDLVRDGNRNVLFHGERARSFVEYHALFRENLERLDDLLLEGDPAGQVMRAEIARERGEFETCLIRLAIIPGDYSWVASQIQQLALQKDTKVRELQEE